MGYHTHLLLEYSSVLQDMICEVATNNGTYSSLSRDLSGSLATAELLFERFQQEKALLYQNNSLHILRKVTTYAKNPNAFCKLYSFNNEIIRWLLFIQGPVTSPFEDSILILELSFTHRFPLFSPKLTFLARELQTIAKVNGKPST